MLSFDRMKEDEIIRYEQRHPLTTAFVVVENPKGFMLLFNKYRKVWELSGGMIEEGESPRECAVRECWEESGQQLHDVEFVGLAKLHFTKNVYRPGDTIEYSALYYAHLHDERVFTENDEIEALRWWTPDENLDDICETSAAMIRLVHVGD